MRIAVVSALLAVVAQAAAQSSSHVEGHSDFDNIFSMVDSVRAEAGALQSRYVDMEGELNTLKETCPDTTMPAAPTPSPAKPTPEPEPTPSPIKPTPEPEPTPSPTKSTPEPEPTPSPAKPTPEPEPTPSPAKPTPEPEPTPSPTELKLEPESAGDEAPPAPVQPVQPEGEEPVGTTTRSSGAGWVPKVGDTWQYNLKPPADTSVDAQVFAIDMDYQQEAIETLHSLGKNVVCYISIGTVEEWRQDASEFPSYATGGVVAGWPREQWLDVKDPTVRELMTARVDKAASMGCDGIEPDNMMAYYISGIGVDVSEADQIDYNIWFAGVVHDRGMKVGLKNCIELLPILTEYFDFAVNESCFDWDECEAYEDTFIAAGKPVFNVEYRHDMNHCDLANELKIDAIVKNYDLEAPLCSCSDRSRDKDCDSVL